MRTLIYTIVFCVMAYCASQFISHLLKPMTSFIAVGSMFPW